MEHRPKYNIVLIFILVPVLLALITVYAGSLKKKLVACTTEAKICPDGTAVGRSGPMCEFAACPPDTYAGWKTFTDKSKGLSFKYPEKLDTKYINVVDWPPKVAITPGPFTCNEAGNPTARAGQTGLVTVDGRNFCVTRELEGAAGSIYGQYAFVTESGGKKVTFTFTLRAPQCGNYDEPKRGECADEEAAFDISPTINRIFNSLTVSK